LLIPIFGFGLFTVFPLVRIARRTGDTAIKLIAAAAVPMTVLFWLAIPLSSDVGQPDNAWDAVGASMLVGLWFGGSIVSIAFVNRRYLAWKRESRTSSATDAAAWSPASTGVGHNTTTWPSNSFPPDALGLDTERGQYLAPTSDAAWTGAAPANTSRPSSRPKAAPAPAWNVPERSPSQTSAVGEAPLDLNRALESDLRAVPGVGPVLAKRILDERRQRGGFRSIDELADLGVPPHVLIRLRTSAVVSPLPGPPPTSGGRVLDL